MSGDLARWLEEVLGRAPRDLALYQRALTHASRSPLHYERLEFLGDRVLGLTIAEWLYAHYADEAEGKLSQRLNTLVTGAVCAAVAREIGVPAWLKLGKQAQDDGAADSDNVLGDVVEALIGALYLEHGADGAQAFIRAHWADRLAAPARAPQHPKSALQEWAAAHNRRAPDYAITDRSGPHHAPRFVVTVSVGKLTAEGRGGSRQEAETAAALALLAEVEG